MQWHLASKTNLVYDILNCTLSGEIDGSHITAHAVSGGRAGSKTPGAVEPALSNNPFMTHVKKSAAGPGGPLPINTYYLRTHESRKNWIRLEPMEAKRMGARAGMAIHGRGKRGSDGCIVPTDFNVVLYLYSLIRRREEERRPPPTLEVVSPFHRFHPPPVPGSAMA